MDGKHVEFFLCFIIFQWSPSFSLFSIEIPIALCRRSQSIVKERVIVRKLIVVLVVQAMKEQNLSDTLPSSSRGTRWPA